MVFNFLQEKVVSKRLIKKIETTCKTRISIDEDDLVSNILDSFGIPSIVAEEKVQDYYNFSGKVDFTVIYENKAKVISSVSGSADFSDKTQIPNAEWIFVVPSIVGMKTVKESSSAIEVNISVGISIYGIRKEDIKPLAPLGQDAVCKTKQISLSSLTCATADTFSVSDDFEFGEGISKLIAVYPSFCINKVTPQENYIVVEGELSREIICLCGEHVRRYTKNCDFTEEISLLGARNNSAVDVSLRLQTIENNYEVFADQNKTVITSVVTFKANAFGFDTKTIETVVDAYSIDSKLLLTTQGTQNTRFVKQEFVSEKLNLTFDSSKLKRIDELISLGNNVVEVESAVSEDGMLSLQGRIVAEAIYKNFENDSLCSARLDFPFKTSQRIETSSDVDLVIASKCDSFKNKPGKEVVATFNIDIAVSLSQNDFDCFVTGAVESEREILDDNTITIYMPSENQTLFEVAKELSVRPEFMIAQNKDVEEEKLPERIVLYHKK